MQTKEKSKVFSEVDAFLNIIDEKYKNKIPAKLRNLYKENKDKSYTPVYDASIPIEKQSIRKETIAMIALLHLNYWCDTEDEKKELRNLFLENEKKYEKIKNEKYNPDNLFKNVFENKQKETEEKDEQPKCMIEYKEHFYTKIMNFLKKLFSKK